MYADFPFLRQTYKISSAYEVAYIINLKWKEQKLKKIKSPYEKSVKYIFVNIYFKA